MPPGTPPLTAEQVERLLRQVDARWDPAPDTRSLRCALTFREFAEAMRFLHRLADLAEREGHHPDFCLTRWNRVSLTLYTHTVDGLSDNDFILAAKTDRLLEQPA